MRKMHVLLVWLLLATASAHAEKVELRIKVVKMDRLGAAAMPFPNIGGFVVRRLRLPYDKARCPNSSNGEGMLHCEIECQKAEGVLRLDVKSPGHTNLAAVRGYFQPSEVAFDVANCAVGGKQPVVLTYKSREVVLGEFTASNPVIVNAVFGGKPTWAPAELKPFGASAEILNKYAESAQGKEAVSRFAELSSVLAQDAHELDDKNLAAMWREYAVGSQSIALRASVGATLGTDAAKLVTISPKKSDLYRSAASVEKQIAGKAALNPGDLAVINEVRAIQRNR